MDDITGPFREDKIFVYLQVSEKLKMQDIWFLLLISVIVAQLRLVGGIPTFRALNERVSFTHVKV